MVGWHTYSLAWLSHVAVFAVDGRQVLQTRLVPTQPLVLLAWIDNRCLRLSEQGLVEVCSEAVPERQWLEISDLAIGRP